MTGKKRNTCDIFSKKRDTKVPKNLKFSDIDESAIDGYDQCGNLVIQTGNDCF